MMIFSAGCQSEFKPEKQTLKLTAHEFNQRFIANVNALAGSMGIDEQADTLDFIKKTEKQGEETTQYRLGDNTYLFENVDSSNKELTSISIMCADGDVAEMMTAETAYVAAIKAVNPEFKGDDFKKLQAELSIGAGNEDKSLSYKGRFYAKRVETLGTGETVVGFFIR